MLALAECVGGGTIEGSRFPPAAVGLFVLPPSDNGEDFPQVESECGRWARFPQREAAAEVPGLAAALSRRLHTDESDDSSLSLQTANKTQTSILDPSAVDPRTSSVCS